MMNIYDGVVTTDEKGYATVPLPEWFRRSTATSGIQLTVLDESDGATFVHAKIVKESPPTISRSGRVNPTHGSPGS